jgi:hypothetical protein
MTLVSYYPLQEDSGDAIDASGNGYTGTVNGATQGQPGILNTTCYSFDGDDDVRTSQTGPITEVPFTAICWMKRSSEPTSYETLIEQYDGSGYWLRLSDANSDGTFGVEAGFRDGSTTGTKFAETDIPDIFDGEWHQIGITAVSTNISGLSICVDGEFYGSIDDDGNINDMNNSAETVIGYSIENGSGRFNGEMSDVRIYDHGITASELDYLYNVTKSSNLTTEAKQTSQSTTSPFLRNLSYSQNGQTIIAAVTGVDGTTETVEQPLDGQSSYTLNFQNAHQDYRITFKLESSDVTTTPTVDSATILTELETISGTVTLGGAGQQNVTVLVINSDTDSLVTTTTTDSNGDYSVDVPANTTYHLAVQYDDGQGNQYNAKSKPFLDS